MGMCISLSKIESGVVVDRQRGLSQNESLDLEVEIVTTKRPIDLCFSPRLWCFRPYLLIAMSLSLPTDFYLYPQSSE